MCIWLWGFTCLCFGINSQMLILSLMFRCQYIRECWCVLASIYNLCDRILKIELAMWHGSPLLPTFITSPGYLHENSITRSSPSNRFKYLYSYRSKPLARFADNSSHYLLGFFALFKYAITQMKGTSKLWLPQPSANRPLQGAHGSCLSP